MNSSIRIIERTYFGLLIFIFFLIVLTPDLVRSDISFLEEQILESILIGALFFIGYFILSLYRKEVDRNLKKLASLEQDKQDLEDRLIDAFKYIGSLNIQIQEIRSLFSDLKKYPESKNDFKNIMDYLCDKVLAMVSCEWVIIKLIDTNTYETLRECSIARGNAIVLKYRLSNKELVENIEHEGLWIVGSSQENFHIKTFCIVPKELTSEERIFITGVVNQLEMLFLIFTSTYYNNASKSNNQERIATGTFS